MSFLGNLSQWNMSDTKNKTANPTEMKIPRFNGKKRKKRLNG